MHPKVVRERFYVDKMALALRKEEDQECARRALPAFCPKIKDVFTKEEMARAPFDPNWLEKCRKKFRQKDFRQEIDIQLGKVS